MNKFRKLFIGAVIAAGVSCLGAAAACTQTPDFYTLTFEGDGIEYIMKGDLEVPDENGFSFESGGKVKEGVEVRFTVLKSANAVGDPVITYNGVTLTPDADGVYSFVISSNTRVVASGLGKIYTLTLSKFEKVLDANGYSEAERRITYLDVDGNDLGEAVQVAEGEDFSFKVKSSVYYLPDFNVCYGSEILEADEDGVYTVTDVDMNNEINVKGVIEEDGFTAASRYADCGNGTEESPFLISRPIDLYYVAALVNSSYSSQYNVAYYKLMNDIDMEGEQLFVIGDMSSTSAIFGGNFDGNGHTISNFYITDEVYDQESYVKEYLPYVGLFGCTSPTTGADSNPAVIKNLNLDNYTIDIHTGEAGADSYVGSLVGYGIGTQITNCHATNGQMNVDGNNTQIVFMGGLVGVMQAAYSVATQPAIIHNSFVSYSSTDITIYGTGSPYSVGGIVGYLISADITAISYVVNSYSTGNISGAIHAGGIVGTLGRFASVSNCYSTSAIIASNGSNNLIAPACAGGIVGYAESDSVVTGCYSANTRLSASSSHGNYTGEFVGSSADGGTYAIDSIEAIVYGNTVKGANDTSSVFTAMGWSEDDWDFSGTLPVVKVPDGNRTITLIIKSGNTVIATYEKEVAELLLPICNWYDNGDIPEYVSHDGKLSWGYYFNNTLAAGDRVPYCFVPTAKETVLYVGLSDYSEVAGKYYIKSTVFSSGAYFELAEDGTVFLRDGGMTFSGVYSYNYNTKEITVYYSCLANLLFTMEEVDGSYFTVVGVWTEQGIELNGIATLIDVDNSTEESTQYKYENFTISAILPIEDFAYGEYLAANGAVYVFSPDGSGSYTNVAGVRQSFTYGEEDDGIYLELAEGGVWEVVVAQGVVQTVNNVAVSKRSDFNGTWKQSSNSLISFSFDGIDSVTCVDGDNTQTVKFETVGNRITFATTDQTYEAYINQDGFLVINGTVYCLDDGFTGSWYMPGSGERIEVTFEGIGLNGYGYATMLYAGSVVATIDAQYDIFTDDSGSVLRIYVEDKQYGELVYNAANNTASGLFYSMNYDAYYSQTTFYLYDIFKGTWVSVAEGVDTVTFNGRTADNTSEAVISNGTATQRGTYTVNGLSGTMTVGGNTYAITFDEKTNSVSFKLSGVEGAEENKLARRDGWYGVVLYDGDTSYTFDGKGYLGGTVSVSSGATLPYTVGEDGSVTVDGNKLVATDDGFTLNGIKLEFKTGFSGEWLISGSFDSITIGEVGGDFTAQAYYSGSTEAISLVYDPATGVLTYTEEVNGERLVTEFKLMGAYELSISRRSVSGDIYINCINSDKVDDWRGVYTAEDGSSWTFDGLGNGIYGSGVATFKAIDGTVTNYKYKVNTIGLPYIRTDSAAVFAETTEGGYSKEGDDKSYDTVVPDAIYDTLAFLTADGQTEWYFFDGMGTLWQRQEDGSYAKAYEYKIVSSREVTLTDADGKTYKGTITSTVLNTQLTITEVKVED